MLGTAFSKPMALMSVTKGVRGGVHIQSCGHHMHYNCRQSYCDTLKQSGSRVPREHQGGGGKGKGKAGNGKERDGQMHPRRNPLQLLSRRVFAVPI